MSLQFFLENFVMRMLMLLKYTMVGLANAKLDTMVL
jgi:hypothetical protein